MTFAYRLIIVSLLVIIAVMAVRSCMRKDKEVSSYETIQDIKTDSTTYWKDAAGREHAQRQLAEGTITAVRAAYRSEVDSLKSILKMRDKDLQGFIAAGVQTTGTIVPKIDTVYQTTDTTYRLKYNDQWLTLQGEIGYQSNIQYQVRDSIIFTTYQKKTGLFRRETYVDGFSMNPVARITGITAVRIAAPSAKRFGIGPYVGYGWDGTRWAPAAGVSVHYSLIKF